MSDLGLDPVFEPLALNILKRISLNYDNVKELATGAGIGQFADKLFNDLSGFQYFEARIGEIISRQRNRYDHPPAGSAADPPTEEFGYDNPGEGLEWEKVFTHGCGQPAHEALLEIYQLLSGFWNNLPPETNRKRRRKWAPQFEKQSGETAPCNNMGILFLTVARLFDPAYCASNCLSVVERIKNLKRSPAGYARLRERRRIQAARHREKQRRGQRSSD